MDEQTSFWNKKSEELTVADQMKVVALIPAVMLGGFVAAGVTLSAVEKIRTKFRKKQPELAVVAPDETE